MNIQKLSGESLTPSRENRILEVLNKRQFNLTIVLENIQDPHNIAAIMRTCDAVGISEIFVINTKTPRKGKYGSRSSSSANRWIRVHDFDCIENCVFEVRKRYHHLICTFLQESSLSLYEVDFTQPIAVVLGNEHEGVSKMLRAQCDSNYIIPQEGIIQSLNVSVACAVSLYEAYRQKSLAGHYAPAPQPNSNRASLLQNWGLTYAD